MKSRKPSKRTDSASVRPSLQRVPHSLPLDLPANRPVAQAILQRRSSHPVIYRRRIVELLGNPRVGDWVQVCHLDNESQEPECFAYGLYNPKSEIAIRLIRWSQDLPDEAFWNGLIDRAIVLRKDVLKLDAETNAYRVIHAEADGFPGLVVDRYADCLSAEIFSMAMAPRVEIIIEKLAARLGTNHWLISPSPHLLSQEGFEFTSRSSPQLTQQTIISEFGTRFWVHFLTGHKTGFFCDQRDNRRRLSELCRDKTVLDVCCYTGGFSVMAAHRGGAREITGIDLDEAPLVLARQNANLNQVRVKYVQADAFAYMRDMLRGGRRFDILVLDPPKMIRNRNEIDEGTRKHFDLNRLAMQLVNPGGLMLTCSCAGLLPESEFVRLVRAAARSASIPHELNPQPIPREMQLLAKAGAACCHPVSANCPETEYFKSLWIRL